jgi:hypothetical protein
MSKDDLLTNQPQVLESPFQQKPTELQRRTERAGLKGAGYSMGVAAADYDNDGFVDLFVTGYKADRLYHNNGDGTFSDVTSKLPESTMAGPPVPAGSTTIATAVSICSSRATWIGTLKAARCFAVVQRRATRATAIRQFQRRGNFLFHQRAMDTFEDVSKSSGIADPSGKGLGVAFADFDNDGWTDVFVANDSVPAIVVQK